MSAIKKHKLRFDHRARFSADSEFFERANILLGKDKVHRHDGIDIFALHHDRSLTGGGPNAIDWMGPRQNLPEVCIGIQKSSRNFKNEKEFQNR